MAEAMPKSERGPTVLAATISVIVIASIFVFLRMVSRIAVVRRFAWDDFFMVLAWLLAFGLSFSVCYGTSRGLGSYDENIPVEWFGSLKRSEYVFSVLYNPALMATKTSILIFYLSLSKVERVFRSLTIATLVVVNVAGLALTFLNIFQCRPVTAVFERSPSGDSRCIDIIALYLGSAPVNIITDLAILFLPMPILTGMRLPKKQKIILVLTFALGGFVAVVDVVRIYYLQTASLQRLQQVGKVKTSSDQVDFSYYASLSFMWSAVEVNIGIICACVPTLKPLVSRALPRLLHDIGNTNLSSHGSLPAEPYRPSEKEAPMPESSTAAIHNPLSASPTSSEPYEEDGDMNFIDFLTTPDTRPADVANKQSPGRTTRADSTASAFFDFVDMGTKKSMVKMSTREALLPLTLVTVLFFLWGFAYGLLDVLNAQFQRIINLSNGQSVALHGAYYAGYFFAPLSFGRIVFKKFGFKATFMAGLCVYGCGTLIFWPSAVLTSYPAFLISNLIVGMGLATLETAANPFIALCGPPQYAELRLNISQAIQAIATVVSLVLARRAFFRSITTTTSLLSVQWTYLGIALFVILLAVAFYYLPLPEASDDDLEDIRSLRYSINERKIGPFAVIFVTLGMAVFSQFCYVAAQEGLSTGFDDYLSLGYIGATRTLEASDWSTVGHALFAAGRFLGALLNVFITPRWLLLWLYIGSIITSALAFRLKHDAALAVILLIYFFEAAIFPTIFAIALRGLGRHTKSGSAYITAAISGGAIGPAIALPILKSRGPQYAMCIVVAFFSLGTLFPIYLCTVPAAKAQVDNVALPARKKHRKRPSFSSAKWGKRRSDVVTTEHIERSGANGAEP